MTFPTVIETPLPLEPVTRDTFADASPAEAAALPRGSAANAPRQTSRTSQSI